jgi:hypothetical protein
MWIRQSDIILTNRRLLMFSVMFARFFRKSLSFSKKRIIRLGFDLRKSKRWLNSQLSGEIGRPVLLQFGAVSAVEEAIVSALVMHEQVSSHDVDPVEEMRMRTWARRHYAPAEQRDGNWHPIVLDEMFRKDRESQIKPR